MPNPEKILRTLRENSSPELQCVIYGLVLVDKLFVTCLPKVNTEIGSKDLEILHQFDIASGSTQGKLVWWNRI